MFGPEYDLAKVRQAEFLAAAEANSGMEIRVPDRPPFDLRARLLLAIGDHLIATGYRLRCAVAPQGC